MNATKTIKIRVYSDSEYGDTGKKYSKVIHFLALRMYEFSVSMNSISSSCRQVKITVKDWADGDVKECLEDLFRN